MCRTRKHEKRYSSFVGNIVYIQANGGTGTVNRKNVIGLVVGDMDMPCIMWRRPSFYSQTPVDRQMASGRTASIRGERGVDAAA